MIRHYSPNPTPQRIKDREEWASKVMLLRRTLGLSQMSLSYILGVSDSTVGHWEQLRSSPSKATRAKIEYMIEMGEDPPLDDGPESIGQNLVIALIDSLKKAGEEAEALRRLNKKLIGLSEEMSTHINNIANYSKET